MGLARRWRVGRGNSASLVLLLGGGGLSRLPWVLLRPGGCEPHTVAQASLQNTASAAGSAASALGRHFAEMNPGRWVCGGYGSVLHGGEMRIRVPRPPELLVAWQGLETGRDGSSVPQVVSSRRREKLRSAGAGELRLPRD